ncbi:MAG: hypothetical protein L6R28_24275 [Planctomycetes bacterium]|nr:hypothetical protein [Planctomycetota bacterium]
MPDKSAKKKTASCACGESTFDLASKAPGETFSCPKCEKKYRLKEDGRLVQIVVKKVKKTVKKIVKRPSGKVAKPVAAGATDEVSGDTLLDDAELLPSVSQVKRAVEESRHNSAAKEAKTVSADLEEDDDLEEIGSDDSAASVSAPTAAMDAPAFDVDGEEALHTSDDEMDAAEDDAMAAAERPKVSKRSSRREEPVRPSRRAERPTTSSRTRFGDAPMDEEELQPPPPITLDKLVAYMFVGAVPAGAILFAVHMWLGLREGIYKFNVYKIWGIEINGNNPLVWIGGILLGVLVFLGLWVAHTYFFVYMRDKKEKAEREEKLNRIAKNDNGSSAKRPRTASRASKRAD